MTKILSVVAAALAATAIVAATDQQPRPKIDPAQIPKWSADDLDFWERKLEQELVTDSTISETDRLAIILARRGQGLFKNRVSKIVALRTTGPMQPTLYTRNLILKASRAYAADFFHISLSMGFVKSSFKM